MRQIIYSLHFRGTATRHEPGSKLLRSTATAISASFTTVVGPSGIVGSFEARPGGDALFESEVTLVSPEAFTEKGSIAFGDDHELTFTSINEGRLSSTPDPKLMSGAVAWKVEGGRGQFAGASGLITSNFTLSDTGERSDYHFGVLFVEDR